MTTYSPVGPFTLTPDADRPTLDADLAEATFAALRLLDARLLSKTIAPERAVRGRYLALGNGSETRLLPLPGGVTHLGRGPEADIRFDDHRLSRDHAIFVHHSRYLRLLDNRSANGTFVNGRRIAATTIDAGDVIDLGPVRMQVIEVR